MKAGGTNRRRVQIARTPARWISFFFHFIARSLRGHNFTAWALRDELTNACETTTQTHVGDLG
jgi:hypothetical protein